MARAVDAWGGRGLERTRRGDGDRLRAGAGAALAGAGRGWCARRGAAPPPLPAPGRDGALHHSADRALPGRARRRWRGGRSCSGTRTPAPTPGFLKIDLLGPGDAVGGRALRRGGRAHAGSGSTSRGSRSTTRRCSRAIRRAETTGVFQIESRAQMQMLPRSLPENLDDLTVQVALVRPGPIQGGAVHPYLERRRLLREDPEYEIPYDHPSLEPILSDTLGAIVFQDQVIQVAMALAGFSPGEAEGLRRAMSRKRSEAALRAYRERFLGGRGRARGRARRVAERVFEQIQGLLRVRLPEVARGRLRAARLPVDLAAGQYGPEFLCSLLNEQPMGFYPPDALVHEAQRRGIEVRGPDVNRERGGVRRSSRSGGPDRARLRHRPARGGCPPRRRGARARGRVRPPRGAGVARSGVGGDALERLPWAGRASRWRRRSSARALAAGASTGAVGAEDGVQLCAAARACRRRPRCATRRLGSRWSPTTRRPG